MRVFIVKKESELITACLLESDAIKICNENQDKGYSYIEIPVYGNKDIEIKITSNETFFL